MFKKVLNTLRSEKTKKKSDVYHKLYHTIFPFHAKTGKESFHSLFENELVTLCCRFMILSRHIMKKRWNGSGGERREEWNKGERGWF